MFNQRSRDYDENPFIVIWEVTRACALKCLHCRAEAQYQPDPRQLSFIEGKRLLDQISEMDKPLFVFTGGDPLMRPDLFELADYAIREKGLTVSMTPSATPKVTRQAVYKAKEAGLARWAYSLDGSNAEIHDYFRGTRGSFDLTMRGIEYLKQLNIPIQINTTISTKNLHDLEAIAEKVQSMGAVLWSLFFLIPTGRAKQADMITPAEHEEVMRWLADLKDRVPYGIKSTEAPHFRRVLLEKNKDNTGSAEKIKYKDVIGRATKGVNDGDGFLFISHTGDVYPSGFLPVKCGNIREGNLADIYRNSSVMKQLRDKTLLKGKCGRCEYKEICGGSRARAFAVTGDYLESDPACIYQPGALDSL